jgi:hypothetical protein
MAGDYYIHPDIAKLSLEYIKQNATQISALTQKPLTFFNAIYPAMWQAATAYVAGQVVRPSTFAAFVYECVTPGNSGGIEPAWGAVQDAEFNDGTVTWKTHENYTLISSPKIPEDFTISPGTGDIDFEMSLDDELSTVHYGGDVAFAALIDEVNGILMYSRPAEVRLGGPTLEQGYTSILKGWKLILKIGEYVE